MRVFLVRHGDAEPPHVNNLRPLSRVGQQQVERLAAFLQEGETKVEAIFHSGILRAQQTAETIADALDVRSVEVMQGLKPNDPVDSMAFLIQEFSRNTMLVGHLPFMGTLAAQLIAGHSRSEVVSFYTATAACLMYQGNNRWAIEWVISADLLR